MKRIHVYPLIISVIGILIYISWSKLQYLDEEPGPGHTSLSNLSYIRDALGMYALESQGKLPDKLEVLVPDYLRSEVTLICPRTSKKTKWPEITGEPYEYLVAGRIWDELEDSEILVKEPSSIKDPYVIRKGYIYPEHESN